jgi:BlaI family penicillinase repressor
MPDPPRISEAEWDVMRVLWNRPGLFAQEVAARIPGERNWSDRTVKTLLGRLVKKGALDFEVEGKRYRYRPALTREECVRAASRSFLERVFGGAVSPMLATFVREGLRAGKLSEEEIAELRRLLDEEEARP